MLSPLGTPETMPATATATAAGAPTPPPGLKPATAGPSRDELDADSARVLDALPARGAAGTSTIAAEAGVDLDTVLRCLGLLAGSGFIERCDRGWRLRKT
jgi:DNA processing protein